jgi:dTMP kinase
LPKPLFIVLEGIDGSGSTTQSQLLFKRMGGEEKAILTREPGGTPLAEKIRDLVLDPKIQGMHAYTELFLYAASRAQHVRERILPALESGFSVVCDRFTASTLAYQGYGRGLDGEYIAGVAALATTGIDPDLTIILDLPVEEAHKRRMKRSDEPDRLELEDLEFHRRVAQGYRTIAANNPQRYVLVDATVPIESLEHRIHQILEARWGSNFPIRD